MNPIATQQAALDNALVPSEKRLKIERCNARIAFSKPQKEETYQVTLEALKLSTCYPAFVITAKNSQPRLYCTTSEEELVTFIQELGYSGRCNMLFAIHTDQMHQPLRTFAAINNRCISGKTTRLDRLRNHELKSYEDKKISMRNMIKLHTIHDESLLDTLKFVSKTQDYQQYGALIPDDMINQDIKDSQAYKTYYDFATGKVPPKKARKYKKVASPSRKLSPVKEAEPVNKTKRKKAPAKADRSKGIEILSDIALSEAAQLKEATKRSKKDFHISQASGSDERTGTNPGVRDVPTYDSESENELWGDSEDDDDDDNANDDDSKGDDDKVVCDNDGSDAHDSERTDSGDDENPSFTLKDYDEEEHDEEYESDVDYENVFKEEDDDPYKDVDVRSLRAEHEKERKCDEEKLSNLEKDVIFDLNVALRMFTRTVVILKREEDLQLGVESYQKKLNQPETFRSEISKMTPYTAYKNPQGTIYKFGNETLTSVKNVLHDISNNLRMDYLPKRKWSNLDRKRPRIMIKAIDQQLFKRRLMRNLEKFVKGREYRNDFRLLERMI
nr:hypothetical protein [Tanacetum cinerariifolium]